MEHIAVELVVYAELDLPTNNYLIEEAKEMEEQKQSYSEEELLQFSEWVSHNDWVYLPSKGYWVNEEEEESEQKFTTKELLEIFKNK
jgi:hypothetical protein